MKQKVLFLITKSNWGGAQRYVFDLATSLRNDFDVSVALGGSGRLVELLKNNGIETVQIPDLARDISIKKEIRSFTQTYRMLRKIRPDILHLNSSKAGGLGALAGRMARVPKIVFTAHAWAWNENRSLPSRILIALLQWLTVMLAHRTICVSHAVYDQMAKLPFTRARMRVVHPGITPAPRVSRAQAREAISTTSSGLESAEDMTWIGYIGELHPVKGLSTAIRAMGILAHSSPDVRLIIIGEGEERKSLEELINVLKLGERVYLVGHINDAASLVSAFDIFVLPSLSEAFGYVLIEAGAGGVPVIASDVGGIPEVIGNNSGILLPSGNAPLLAEELSALLNSPEKQRSIALALKERTLNYFTKDRMVKETTDVYIDMAS